MVLFFDSRGHLHPGHFQDLDVTLPKDTPWKQPAGNACCASEYMLCHIGQINYHFMSHHLPLIHVVPKGLKCSDQAWAGWRGNVLQTFQGVMAKGWGSRATLNKSIFSLWGCPIQLAAHNTWRLDWTMPRHHFTPTTWASSLGTTGLLPMSVPSYKSRETLCIWIITIAYIQPSHQPAISTLVKQGHPTARNMASRVVRLHTRLRKLVMANERSEPVHSVSEHLCKFRLCWDAQCLGQMGSKYTPSICSQVMWEWRHWQWVITLIMLWPW